MYFYTIIGTIASLVFFASPGKGWLIKRLKARNQSTIHTEVKHRVQKQPLMGLPEDPGGDVEEAVNEIRQEVEARRRSGSKVGMPSGDEMRRAVEERIGKKVS